MVMSTQSLASASKLLEGSLLVDKINVYQLGEPETSGFEVIRPLIPHYIGYPALVQTTTLNNAAESAVENLYSIKVTQGVAMESGMVIEVSECSQEPSLVGKKLLIDKISQNGLSIIRKAVASDYHIVNQEGKAGW